MLAYDTINYALFTDDKSELGMEELMGEANTLRAVHQKVYILSQ